MNPYYAFFVTFRAMFAYAYCYFERTLSRFMLRKPPETKLKLNNMSFAQ